MKTFIGTLHKYAQRWWYLPLMAVFVFMTLFVAVLPSELFVVKAVLLRPKRWTLTVVLMAVSSGLAAFVFALLVKTYGEPVLTSLLGDSVFTSQAWFHAKSFFERLGGFAVLFSALSPIPMQFGIALAALGDHSPLYIGCLAFLGRVLKYLFFSYLALKTPHLYRKYFGKSKVLGPPPPG